MTPHIVTVSGPSLSGKTEFTKILQKEYGFNSVVSVTTRPQRSSEVNGIDYHFISPEEYSKLTLIQKTDFNNFQYGVSEEEVLSKQDKPILWVVAPQSIQQIEDYCKDKGFLLTKIFITNPQEVLFERLFNRFQSDKNASTQTYVNRLKSIVNVEQNWVKEASEDYFNKKYDLIYHKFDNSNTQNVIDEALEHINQKTLTSTKSIGKKMKR